MVQNIQIKKCIASQYHNGGSRCEAKAKMGDFCGRHGKIIKCVWKHCPKKGQDHPAWEHNGRWDLPPPVYPNDKARKHFYWEGNPPPTCGPCGGDPKPWETKKDKETVIITPAPAPAPTPPPTPYKPVYFYQCKGCEKLKRDCVCPPKPKPYKLPNICPFGCGEKPVDCCCSSDDEEEEEEGEKCKDCGVKKTRGKDGCDCDSWSSDDEYQVC